MSVPVLSAGENRSSRAADFCLESSQGDLVCLHDYLEEGPVVLWFYRGYG